MGITQKALAHGVPVVAVPFGRDQPEVARRVEVAGAGVRLPARKLSPDRLRDAVRRAIELRPGAERIAAAFAAAGGAVAAADELEALIPRSTEVLHRSEQRRRKEHPMTAMKDAAAEFLGHKRVAVTGVSRTPGNHGSNVVYKRLRERGYEVFAVNPNADEVEGDPAYHDLRSIPGGVEAVVIGTRPEIAEETMRECAELGIKHVWMHRGPGAGSVSEDRDRVRPRARHHRDRRRLPVHVRADRRFRAQGDAVRLHPERQRAQAGLNRPPSCRLRTSRERS